ncbi:hypothetical protein AB0N23_16495 [Streptomyces sp. NPDC052644]
MGVVGALVLVGVPESMAGGIHAAWARGGDGAPSVEAGATEERRALAEAAETGRPVEVVGARTEFTTTYANTDANSRKVLVAPPALRRSPTSS